MSNTLTPSPLITLEEAATYLGLSRGSVLKITGLNPKKIGRRYFFAPESLVTWREGVSK